MPHAARAIQTGDESAPTCRKPYAPDMACGINTIYYPATAAPRTWQYPVWGTPEWQAIYNKRTAVERYFVHLKQDAGVGFRKDQLQLRGLAKVALITGLAVVATTSGCARHAPSVTALPDAARRRHYLRLPLVGA